MKNKILYMCMLLLTIGVQAQSDEKTVSFGLRGGINFQNFNGKDDQNRTIKNSLVARYHVGANVEFLLVPDFYLQPGLLFITKGSKTSDVTYRLNYIELPVNLVFKPKLGTGKVLLGFGPYIAYGVGGKVTYGGNSYKVNYENSSNLGNFPYTFKPFDAGANFLAGYEFGNGFSFQLDAQLGLVRINPPIAGTSSDASVKNTGFGLSLGYRF